MKAAERRNSKLLAVAVALLAAGFIVQFGGDALISGGVLPASAWRVLRTISYSLLAGLAGCLLAVAVSMIREAWRRK